MAQSTWEQYHGQENGGLRQKESLFFMLLDFRRYSITKMRYRICYKEKLCMMWNCIKLYVIRLQHNFIINGNTDRKMVRTEPHNTIPFNQQQGEYFSQSQNGEGGDGVVVVALAVRVHEFGVGRASEGALKVCVCLAGSRINDSLRAMQCYAFNPPLPPSSGIWDYLSAHPYHLVFKPFNCI